MNANRNDNDTVCCSQYRRNWNAYEKNRLSKYKIPIKKWNTFSDMPVEYVVGFAEFYQREFKVTQDVLIPRSESEGLVKLALSLFETRLQEIQRVKLKTDNSGYPDIDDINVQPMFHFADVGTGSGNIGLSIYLELLSMNNSNLISHYLLSDLDTKALEVAKTNMHRLLPKADLNKFILLKSDLLSGFPKYQFDIITANLPYIPSELLKLVDSSVKYYEPNLALDGGKDGLSLIRAFLVQSKNYLNKKGVILLEIDSRAVISRSSLGLNGSIWNCLVIHDDNGRQRYLIIGNRPHDQLGEIVEAASLSYNPISS